MAGFAASRRPCNPNRPVRPTGAVGAALRAEALLAALVVLAGLCGTAGTTPVFARVDLSPVPSAPPSLAQLELNLVPNWTQPLSAFLENVQMISVFPADGCSRIQNLRAPNDPNFADGSLRRKMAFLNAGTCSTSRQLENVLFAGGVGMVVVDLDTAAEAANLHSSAVPIFGLAQAQANALRTALAGQPLNISLPVLEPESCPTTLAPLIARAEVNDNTTLVELSGAFPPSARLVCWFFPSNTTASDACLRLGSQSPLCTAPRVAASTASASRVTCPLNPSALPAIETLSVVLEAQFFSTATPDATIGDSVLRSRCFSHQHTVPLSSAARLVLPASSTQPSPTSTASSTAAPPSSTAAPADSNSTAAPVCRFECSGRGICIANNTCICDAGYGGYFCNEFVDTGHSAGSGGSSTRSLTWIIVGSVAGMLLLLALSWCLVAKKARPTVILQPAPDGVQLGPLVSRVVTTKRSFFFWTSTTTQHEDVYENLAYYPRRYNEGLPPYSPRVSTSSLPIDFGSAATVAVAAAAASGVQAEDSISERSAPPEYSEVDPVGGGVAGAVSSMSPLPRGTAQGVVHTQTLPLPSPRRNASRVYPLGAGGPSLPPTGVTAAAAAPAASTSPAGPPSTAANRSGGGRLMRVPRLAPPQRHRVDPFSRTGLVRPAQPMAVVPGRRMADSLRVPPAGAGGGDGGGAGLPRALTPPSTRSSRVAAGTAQLPRPHTAGVAVQAAPLPTPVPHLPVNRPRSREGSRNRVAPAPPTAMPTMLSTLGSLGGARGLYLRRPVFAAGRRAAGDETLLQEGEEEEEDSERDGEHEDGGSEEENEDDEDLSEEDEAIRPVPVLRTSAASLADSFRAPQAPKFTSPPTPTFEVGASSGAPPPPPIGPPDLVRRRLLLQARNSDASTDVIIGASDDGAAASSRSGPAQDSAAAESSV